VRRALKRLERPLVKGVASPARGLEALEVSEGRELEDRALRRNSDVRQVLRVGVDAPRPVRDDHRVVRGHDVPVGCSRDGLEQTIRVRGHGSRWQKVYGVAAPVIIWARRGGCRRGGCDHRR
jgi:hypothetical protein